MVNRHTSEFPQRTQSRPRRLLGVVLMALMLLFLTLIAATHLKS